MLLIFEFCVILERPRFVDKMLESVPVNWLKNKIQSKIVNILTTSSFSLNVVNRYKENIVHLSAANNCIDILKCILEKCDNDCLQRKNSLGWTPLMQAVRNENIEMVKFLLSSGANVNDFSFLGLSLLSLACAISNEMFELLHNNCPSALEYASHDDINPLCIAAMKNDRELFFKLIHLGLDVNKSNAFTHIMMKQSKVADIVALAKVHINSENYWSDLSSIEELLKETNNKVIESHETNVTIIQSISGNSKESICIPKVFVHSIKDNENRSILTNNMTALWESHVPDYHCPCHAPISPTLSYFKENVLPMSPNTYITMENPTSTFAKFELNVDQKTNLLTSNDQNNIFYPNSIKLSSPLVLQRCQDKRPPNLMLRSLSNDSDTTLSFTPHFSPIKTPNLPSDINEDNVFDETTPTPPKYKTPPRGIIMDPNTTKLMIILQRFGLQRHVSLFTEQEVDFDLFLVLSDQDLIEIGIQQKSERLILLSVINECKGIKE